MFGQYDMTDLIITLKKYLTVHMKVFLHLTTNLLCERSIIPPASVSVFFQDKYR